MDTKDVLTPIYAAIWTQWTPYMGWTIFAGTSNQQVGGSVPYKGEHLFKQVYFSPLSLSQPSRGASKKFVVHILWYI